MALASLPLTEQLAWIAERRARLHQKQARERAYLNRRATRGVRTPTDEVYEADALLENDLFEALDLLAFQLQMESLKSTYQEILNLVTALRQVPEIERVTAPELVPEGIPTYFEQHCKASLECVDIPSSLSDLVHHTGQASDQTMQQP